jgi:hypothetical protein
VHNAQLNPFKCRRSFIALSMNYQLTVRARFWSRVAPRSLLRSSKMCRENMERYSRPHLIEKKKSARAASNASW